MSDFNIFKRKKNSEINGSGGVEFIVADEYCHISYHLTLNNLVKFTGKRLLADGHNLDFEITDKAYNVDKEYTYNRLNNLEQKKLNSYIKNL